MKLHVVGLMVLGFTMAATSARAAAGCEITVELSGLPQGPVVQVSVGADQVSLDREHPVGTLRSATGGFEVKATEVAGYAAQLSPSFVICRGTFPDGTPETFKVSVNYVQP